MFELDYLDLKILEEDVEYEDIFFGSKELIEEFIEDFEKRIGVDRVLDVRRGIFDDWFRMRKAFWDKNVNERILEIVKGMEEKIKDVEFLVKEFRKDVDKNAYLYLMKKNRTVDKATIL